MTKVTFVKFEIGRDKSYKYKTLVQQASRFIYLIKTCCNSLFRVNAQGQFNTHLGKYKNPKILDIDSLEAVNQYLNHNQVVMMNLDFQ